MYKKTELLSVTVTKSETQSTLHRNKRLYVGLAPSITLPMAVLYVGKQFYFAIMLEVHVDYIVINY